MKQIGLVVATSVLFGLVPGTMLAHQPTSGDPASSGGDTPALHETVQGKDTRAPQDTPVQIAVENNAYLDMHIYVIYSGGLSRSLGMVTGLSKRTLVIPRQVIHTHSEIQLFADPIGGNQGYLSETMFASPGERIRFTIQNLPGLSTAWIEAGYAEEEADERADTAPAVH
ncbi:MAG: hypothetical protein OXT72_05420 [Gammaproteobacteria bacterium]|nr:hypothetical protein [Gammaproteobacteria bacterium]MDE0246953.1 hypothetical protein [Gammaproteobacteria bacterium]